MAKKAKLSKASVKRSLKTYFENNLSSNITSVKGPKGQDVFIIQNLWGDNTLICLLPSTKMERSKLIRALNKVWLPEQFSAIYHVKDKALEVLWTAYKLGPATVEVGGRKFTFRHSSVDYECEFGDSSKDLMTIVSSIYPTMAPSHTQHRNTGSLSHYARSGETKGDAFDKPRSFWVRNVPMESEFLVTLSKHINFYMQYFDHETPSILIHPIDIDQQEETRERYLHGNFPSLITSKKLDPNLLTFWNPHQESISMTRFLFCYRILEYAAYQYVESDIRNKILKYLSAPDAFDKLSEVMRNVVLTFNKRSLEMPQRRKMLINEALEPSLLWSEIEKNREFFQNPVEFDGGFKLKSLITESDTKETFCNSGIDSFAISLNKIRNALAHGKDIATSGSITPTHSNEQKLQPWVKLVEILAAEVILTNEIIY